MISCCHRSLVKTALLLIFSMLLSAVSITTAGAAGFQENNPVQTMKLLIGKSTVLHCDKSVKRVSVGNPEVADFILLSPKEIYLTGKKAGLTNLSLWQGSTLVAIYDLEVTYDVTLLKRQLYELLPNEKELGVTATNNSITLSGRVSTAGNLEKAIALAGAFAPEGKINNLVEVGGVHQVMLEVRVAEVSKQVTKELGINFGKFNDNGFGLSLLGGGLTLSDISEELTLLVSPSVNALFQFNSGNATWLTVIDALKEDGLAKVLAEPTLIALSGQSASFLAGGEFPVPVPSGLGTVGIDYKDYGVGLTFTPVVLGENRLNISVTPSVSELDFSAGLQFSGYVVPALTKRTATTTIELGDGQSFAIAGLLSENITEDVAKFPLLGDVPVLGALFRSQSFLKSETELVIVVTPRLVKPIEKAGLTYPTDFYVEPTDNEFYLEGLLQGRTQEPGEDIKVKMDGDFGHALPDLE